MKNRPTSNGAHGSLVTTPMAATMVQLLGGVTSGGVAVTHDEFRAIKKLYGYVPEKPNKKPPAPKPPKREDFKGSYEYENARQKHEEALKAHGKWTDPRAFMQAGADRNAFREAEADGLRLLAWIAKFVEPGQDPLKTLIQFAIEAGVSVDPSDVTWADENLEDVG